MTRTFSLLNGEPSGFGVEVHPERIKLLMDRKGAVMLLRQLVQIIDDAEPSITLHGSWIPEHTPPEPETPLFPS